MSFRGFRTLVVCIPAACSVLTLLSCGHSPTAPTGRLVVYVSENGDGPAPGKKIEVVGTSRTRLTDENGIAVFIVPAGNQVVRAYEIGTPGPPPPFVEQSVEVQPSRTSRVAFNDCTLCVSPSRAQAGLLRRSLNSGRSKAWPARG